MALKASLGVVHNCLASAWRSVRRDYFNDLIDRESDLVASLYTHLRGRFKKTDYEHYHVFTEWEEITGMRTDLMITHTPDFRPYVAIEAKMAEAIKSKVRDDRRKLKKLRDKDRVRRGYVAYIWLTPEEKRRWYEGLDMGTGKMVDIRFGEGESARGVAFTMSRMRRTRQWQKGFWGECKGWDDEELRWEVLRY